MTKPYIIGLCGRAGSGKDTVRNLLEVNHGFTGLAFADPIRSMIEDLLTSASQPSNWITDRDLKEKTIPVLGVSYRTLAQTLGTEWGRTIDPDLWVRIAEHDIRAMQLDSFADMHFVISDVRFTNEASWIHKMGGQVWRIERAGIAEVRHHVSETTIDSIPIDMAIENHGSLEDLMAAIDLAMSQ